MILQFIRTGQVIQFDCVDYVFLVDISRAYLALDAAEALLSAPVAKPSATAHVVQFHAVSNTLHKPTRNVPLVGDKAARLVSA